MALFFCRSPALDSPPVIARFFADWQNFFFEIFVNIQEIFSSLQSQTEEGRSSAGLERFSHIEEVIGSNPIVPTGTRNRVPFSVSGAWGIRRLYLYLYDIRFSY